MLKPLDVSQPQQRSLLWLERSSRADERLPVPPSLAASRRQWSTMRLLAILYRYAFRREGSRSAGAPRRNRRKASCRMSSTTSALPAERRMYDRSPGAV